jgi:hypothetical protein
MSLLVTTIHAYDLLDTVYATVAVRRYEGSQEEASSTVFGYTTTVLGIGETDPAAWLRDVLVALLENT